MIGNSKVNPWRRAMMLAGSSAQIAQASPPRIGNKPGSGEQRGANPIPLFSVPSQAPLNLHSNGAVVAGLFGVQKYTIAYWRHVGQTIFTLQHLEWRAPGGRHRRPLDHWQVHRRYGTGVGLRV